MTITSKTKRVWRSVVIASALATFAAGETRSQQLTLDQLARMGGADAGEFPLVRGTRTLRARFQEKRIYTIADGSRQTLFVFRAADCWLKESTAAERAVIDCTGNIGPGVFIPVLLVTPPSSKQRLDRPPPDLVLRSRYRNSLADFIPEELLNGPRPYDPSRSIWIKLINPQAESLSLSAPAAPVALVLCVPVAAGECQTSANAQLANLGGPAGQAVVAVQPPQPAVRPPPAPVTPAPVQPPSSGSIAQPTPVIPVAPITPAPPRPSAGEILASPAVPIPPPATAQLHYVIRPAAGATPPDWTPARMAKRLVDLLSSTQSEFFLKTRDGGELRSSLAPELAGASDAVVVWSGDNPQGSSEFIFRGVDGLELLPWTQPADAQPTSATLASPRIRATDYISFAEYRIATPYLYDQWQASIEAVTTVYGRELPSSLTDSCRFSLLVPRAGWISFLTGPNSVGLERTEQAGRNILLSRPVIAPADLMRGGGEPLQLGIQPANDGRPCASERINLAAFGAGNAWKLSTAAGNPSTGRMDIRTLDLPAPGRWLLGLYGPQNVAAGIEGAAADAQVQIFNSFTAFLENFNARHFENGQTATGADLALISAADALSPTFLEKNVIVGKFRQPPPQNGLFKLDPEGNSRLSAFLSDPSNTGTDVSFRSVGQVIRHYSDLFGHLSGLRPPIAVYVGAAHPVPGTCPEWKTMTADIAKLPGRPRVFAVAFVSTGTDEIARQLEENGRGAEEMLGGQTRALTCAGEGGSTLLFVPFPHLVLRTPEAVLGPAFEAVERWATKVQN